MDIRNISSTDIEDKEVAGIAQELKQSLGDTKPAAPAPAPEPAKKEDDDNNGGDTIYIDREGNLRTTDEPSATDDTNA